MGSVIKRRVLEVLRDHLSVVLSPDVPDHDIVVGSVATERQACFPHVTIKTVGPFTFQPFDDDEVWTTASSQAVHVGDMSGQIEVTIGATDEVQRETLEELVLHHFFSQQSDDGASRRGVLVAQLDDYVVNRTANLATVPVAFVLGTETWEEEMVWERKRFSKLVLDVDLPALVVREGIYTIETLVSAITEDLTSVDPAYDQLAVSEAGDLSPYP